MVRASRYTLPPDELERGIDVTVEMQSTLDTPPGMLIPTTLLVVQLSLRLAEQAIVRTSAHMNQAGRTDRHPSAALPIYREVIMSDTRYPAV